MATSTATKPLSPTMRACLAFMRESGGLDRLPGGFWVAHGFGIPGPKDRWFNTSTVEALVSRGVARYTAWQQGHHRQFPIRCEIAPEGQ